MVKKISIIFGIILLFCQQSIFADFPTLPSNEGIYLYEADSNTVVYKQNENVIYSPASITKILTALIMVENVPNLDEVVTVGEEVYDFGYSDSRAHIWNGQQLTYRDLLYAMLVPSGNDAAQTIAINVGKKLAATEDRKTAEEAFYNAMNQKAEDLGMINSHFSNPHGRTSADHYTTPEDYVKVLKAAFDYPEIQKAASTKTYVLKNQNGTDNILYSSDYCLYSNNIDMAGSPYRTAMIPDVDKVTPGTIIPNPYYSELVSAAKTGSNDNGRRTYVFYSQQDGKDLYGIIMDTDSTGIFTQAKQVLETVSNNYIDYNLNQNFNFDQPIEIENTSIISPNELTYTINDTSIYDDQSKNGEFNISYRFDPTLISSENGSYTLNNTIDAGQKIGAVLIENSNGVTKTVPIYSEEKYYTKNFIDYIYEHRLYFILGTIILIGVIIGIIVAVVHHHNKKRTRIFD